jgi:hypothetical protein
MLLTMNNDDNDIEESEDEPQVPTIVATDPDDLAGCDQFVSTAHIAPNGILMDTLTGRDIDIRAIGEDLGTLLMLVREPTPAQQTTIDWLTAQVQEKRGVAVLVRRVEKRHVLPSPQAIDLRVAADVWDHVVGLVTVLLDEFKAPTSLRRRMPMTPASWRVRWLSIDPRPAPMMRTIKEVLTGKRVFVGARLPAAAESWHMEADFEIWSAGAQLVFAGDNDSAEVLLIEQMTDPAPIEVLRQPEVMAHDPRPFDGRMSFIADVETAARRIAALHLLHEDAMTTELLIEQCALNQTVAVSVPGGGRSPNEHRRLTLGMAVNELLGKQVFDLVTRE